MKREITIGGLVTNAEGLGLKAAVHELKAQLADLSPDSPWVVRLGFLAPGFRPPKAPKHPDVFVTSMLPELDHPQDPIGVTEARWREHLGLEVLVVSIALCYFAFAGPCVLPTHRLS